jgi:hypothetical protein
MGDEGRGFETKRSLHVVAEWNEAVLGAWHMSKYIEYVCVCVCICIYGAEWGLRAETDEGGINQETRNEVNKRDVNAKKKNTEKRRT